MTFFSQKTFPIFGVVILTAMTLGTTGMSIFKASQSLAANIKTEVPEVKEVNSEVKSGVKVEVTPKVVNTNNSKAVVKSSTPTNSAKTVGVSSTSSSGSSSSMSNTQTTQATTDNRCVVTLFGQQYDVTTLRGSHPGGDIFVCSTDMSATYQKAHGTDLSRMQKYLITGNSTTAGTGSSSSAASSSLSTETGNSTQKYIDDDGEDLEDEDESEIKEEDKKNEEDKVEDDQNDLRSDANWGTASNYI